MRTVLKIKRKIKRKIACLKYQHSNSEVEDVVTEIDNIKMPLSLSLGKMAQKMYYNAYECGTRWLLEDILMPGDTFIDIGSNIGFFSAVAASIIGPNGTVHSFEPVPKYFKNIRQLKQLNPDYNFLINNVALGEMETTAEISVHLNNPGGSSIVKGFFKESETTERIQVSVKTLDNYTLDNNIKAVKLIKIDTEGYELPVLLGARKFLAVTENLPALIIEVNPNAYKILGYDSSLLNEFMEKFGYTAFTIYDRKTVDFRNYQKGDFLFLPEDKLGLV